MHYKALVPSQFLQAAVDFAVPLTLTICKVELEELPDLTPGAAEKATKRRGVVRFSDHRCGWVMNTTNAACLAQMFGKDTTAWVGKRVTLHSEQVQSFGKMEAGIRISGSPDLSADMTVTVRLMKKKPLEMMMRRTGGAKSAQIPTPHYDALQALATLHQVSGEKVKAWLKSQGRARPSDVTPEDVTAYKAQLESEAPPTL